MSIEKIEILTKKLEKAESIITSLSKVQSMYILEKDRSEIFESLLQILLEASGSEYGFIGEILNKEGKSYLKTYAITDISWSEETKKFYKENAPNGMEFTNLNSLFGETIVTGESVMTNDPSNHPKSCGIPAGHPPLKSYLGIPFKHGEKTIGMCGIANRDSGYDDEILDSLSIIITAASQLIQAHINNHKGFKVE